MPLNALARHLAVAGLLMPLAAHAQADARSDLQRVEVTGSNIRSVAGEDALPVQVFTRAEIERLGITGAEQLMNYIATNGQGMNGLSSRVASTFNTFDLSTAGSSSADLRGLGADATLVLLDGRRVSTFGLSGSTVDLNSIPMAAIDRVEVLKDGASAIYGTDAIGGVINFILRRDVRGLTVGGSADLTQHGGGNLYDGYLVGGFGDLAADRFNVMGTLSWNRAERLAATRRGFSNNGLQPDRGLSADTTGAPIATLGTGSGTALAQPFYLPGDPQPYNRFNPLGWAGQCGSVPGMGPYDTTLWAGPSQKYGCTYDYGRDTVLQQPAEREDAVMRATWQVDGRRQVFVEANGSHSVSHSEYTPVQLTGGYLYPAYLHDLSGKLVDANGNPLPAGSPGVRAPYYLDLSPYLNTGGQQQFDNTLPEQIRWRCLPCGPREQETSTDAYRVLLGMQGEAAGRWDYKLGLSVAGSRSRAGAIDGAMSDSAMQAAMGTGLVDPFSLTQTPAALALIDAAKVTGTLYAGSTRLVQADGAVSGALWELPAGSLEGAVGLDLRDESYHVDTDASEDLNGFDTPDALGNVSRRVYAAYGELQVPVLRTLSAQLALRHDQYSDAGGTTNPKIALRWQPLKSLLFRGSAGTGFHAPDYDELYGGQVHDITATAYADPKLCPDPNAPGANPDVCDTKFDTLEGGNPKLRPETSFQWMLGVVASPARDFTIGIDVVDITRRNRVVAPTADEVLGSPALAGDIVRNPDGTIAYINLPLQNLAEDNYRAIDLTAQGGGALAGGRWTASMDGTYIARYRRRQFSGDAWTNYAGSFGDDDMALFLRWKHVATVNWSTAGWGMTLTQRFWSGYREETPVGTPPPGFRDHVSSYVLYDASATCTEVRDLSLTVGLHNLFDRKPSFTAHNIDDVSGPGYDSRVADPRGRSLWLAARYEFR
ncbi:MAG TPA: TonB-dependent receptor [Burkholderiaceae bacterium]